MTDETTDPGLKPEDLQHLLSAIVSIGSELSLPVVLQRITDTAIDLVDARFGALGVLDESGKHLAEFIYSGIDAATAAAIGDLPSGKGILGTLIVDPRPIRLAELSSHADSFGFPPNHPPMGSFLGVPLRIRGQVFGNLYLCSKNTGGEFSAADEQLVIGLATAAGVAIENARLHTRVGELRVVEDRERIARDLHDTVIQRMFAIGLSLQSLSTTTSDPVTSDRLQQMIEDLDDTVRDIRTTIFELQRPRFPGRSLRQEVLDLVEEIEGHATIDISIRFDGPVDLAVPDSIADHLIAVVRESVTNAIRHSQCARVSIDISAGEALEATISDDGIGFNDDAPRGNGLQNLRSRARELGGECTVTPNEPSGTIIAWRVPLSAES